MFVPKVQYNSPGANKKNAILRYIGNRVIHGNKNFLCAVTGQTGMGKSWGTLSMCEEYSKIFNIPFDVEIHTIHNLKQLLELIINKKLEKNIQKGSVLLFEEPQVDHNAKNWQTEQNKMLSTLLSTFRNQRLVVFFSTPYLTMIDKQSRILFHGEFKIEGYDRRTGITSVKPRFLEYNGDMEKFYKKMLIVNYAIKGKRRYGKDKIFKWCIPRAAKELTELYEKMKSDFSTKLNLKLYNGIIARENKEIADEVDPAEVFKRVRDIYDKHNGDFVSIFDEIPGIAPGTLRLWLQSIKKHKKALSADQP